MPSVIFSVGHSTRPLDAFLGLLMEHGVEAIVDVRRFPGSRRFPQFSAEALPVALRRAAIRYTHMPELGGRRRPRPDSVNTAWRNSAFRGYADYMLTPDFAVGLNALLALAAQTRLALLCAEALWWRCHRRLIADVLVVRGYVVEHIHGAGSTVRHQLPSFAHLDGCNISYPGGHMPVGERETGDTPR